MDRGLTALRGLLELGERLLLAVKARGREDLSVPLLPGDLEVVDLSWSSSCPPPKENCELRFGFRSGEAAHNSCGSSPRMSAWSARSEVGEGECLGEFCGVCLSLGLSGKSTSSLRPKDRPHRKLGGDESRRASSSIDKLFTFRVLETPSVEETEPSGLTKSKLRAFAALAMTSGEGMGPDPPGSTLGAGRSDLRSGSRLESKSSKSSGGISDTALLRRSRASSLALDLVCPGKISVIAPAVFRDST